MRCPIPLRGLVVEQESRTTKKGDLFWQVILKTKIGFVKAFMWDAPNDVEQNMSFPHLNDIIEIDGFKDQLEDRNNIVINQFHRIRKDDLLPDDLCILEFESASEKEIKEAWELIEDNSFWEDTNKHKFTMYCLEKLGRDRVERSPAAARVHHHYIGGLLIHTSEVLAMCKAHAEIAGRYNFINKDVIYSSAILHDIGKVETYVFNELGIAKQTPMEKIVGHIFCGMALVKSAFLDGSVDVEQQFVTEVLHCIAAHHGSREWGSIVETQSLEAGIVSRFDYISSRYGMMEQLLKESIKSGQPLPDEFTIYGQKYFSSIGIKNYMSCGKLNE